MEQINFVIVVPTYNRSDKIVKAIESVFSQTYKKWQIIIVDDCSEIFHSEQIQQYIGNKDKISYYRLNKNHGHCYARNYALNLIDNNYWVKYLDDDDEILPNCLEDINNFLIKNPTLDVISTKYVKKFDIGEKVVSTNYLECSVFNGHLDTSAICHKRSLFERLGGWDERLYRMADDDFFFKYITNGNYGYCDKVTSVFYDTSDEDRVTNLSPNLKYCNIIAEKYDYFYNNRCLVVTSDKGNIENENYNIESFMPFDISDKAKKGYKYIIKYDCRDSLNKIFQKHYKTKKDMFEFGNSFFCKGI
jgi:glycosyltransferase involved in cell wall biosynthesis